MFRSDGAFTVKISYYIFVLYGIFLYLCNSYVYMKERVSAMQFDETKEYTKEELIGFCRYYKGEEESPYQDEVSFYWAVEMAWVSFVENGNSFSQMLPEYIASGLDEILIDNIPRSLKATLFNRFCQYSSGGLHHSSKEFQREYQRFYS